MRLNFHEYHDMKIVSRINPDSEASRDRTPCALGTG